MTSKIKKACGNPDCGTSSGICGRVTFGSGKLDDYGYWEHPCRTCAEAWEARRPEAACWPNDYTQPEGGAGIYFRPLLRDNGKVAICEMQWFDEFSYDQKKFLTDQHFSSEEAAKEWVLLNQHLVAERAHLRSVFDE